MTTEPTTTKDLTVDLLQGFAERRLRELADQLEIERTEESGAFVLRFRYGRATEPFKIQGKTAREQLRDLGVHLERFLGART